MHNDWDAAQFGELLERALRESRLTQRQLARAAGVSHSQMSRWKAGEHRPNYENTCALVVALTFLAPALGDLPRSLLPAAGYAEPDFRPLPRSFRRIVERVLPDPADQRRIIGLMEGTVTLHAADESQPEQDQGESRPQAG